VTFQVKRTPLADRQIRQEARWWRQNRTKAPRLFRDELERAIELIAEYPDAGPLAEDVDLPNVRRILMGGTQHFSWGR